MLIWDSGCVSYQVSGKKLTPHTVDGYTYYNTPRAYRRLGLPVKFAEHTLMWWLHHGALPVGDVDHRNLIRSDNSITNLRIASRSQNMMNIFKHKDSTSGIKNVSYRKDANKWGVRLSIKGSYKSFGSYDDKELAELVATLAREKYHGDYARS